MDREERLNNAASMAYAEATGHDAATKHEVVHKAIKDAIEEELSKPLDKQKENPK